ncbi:MAG: DUF222 domain-containing protein [Actinomycetota bacterium]
MGQLKSFVDQLVLEPIDQFTNTELADSLKELESAVSTLEAERSRRLSLFNQRKGHHEFEYPSPSSFLIDRCRVAPHRAARLVAQANALPQMPFTAKAWASGHLASDQVRYLLTAQAAHPVTFAMHEEMLVDTVAGLSVVGTGRAVAYWRQAVDHQAAEAGNEELFQQRRLHLSQTFAGMWRVDGFLDPLAGELLSTALQTATPAPMEGDTRTAAQRRADALTDLARQALDDGTPTTQGREKPHLLVLVDVERLHRTPLTTDPSSLPTVGLAESVGGAVFSQSTIDLLACDCAVSRIVFGPGSEVIDLGRKSRVIPAAMRRAVIARDRHCQHAGCYRPARWCDIDHITSWLDGGETRLANLQLLCRYHHRLKHLQPARSPSRPSRTDPPETRPPVLTPMRT